MDYKKNKTNSALGAGSVNNFQVSCYKNFQFVGTLPFINIFKGITSLNWDNQISALRKTKSSGEDLKKIKQNLPAFTPCATFDKRRKLNHLITYNQIIMIDFDHILVNVKEDCPVVKAVNCDQHTFCSFISPSGDGLKILVRVDSTLEQHENAFYEVTEYYEKLIDCEADRNIKDINRMCFVSADERAYLNKDAKIFNVTNEPVIIEPETIMVPSSQIIFNDRMSYDKALELTNNKMQFAKYNRNNYVNLLANNCNRLGVSEQFALTVIISSFTDNDFDVREITKTVASAYSHKEEHNKYPLTGKSSNLDATSLSSSWDLIKPTHTITSTLGNMIDRVITEPPVKMVYSVIKEYSTGLLYGVAKTGKTIFCENLGMSIAAGRNEFLGAPLNIENKKVLFLSLEEHYNGRTNRNLSQLNDFTDSERQLINKNYFVATENLPKQIITANDWNVISTEIEKIKPGIVIIDSLTRLVNDQIEQVEFAKTAMLRLREIPEKYQTTVIVIHHSTKLDYSQPMTLQNVAGSRVISQEADFIIGINKTLSRQNYIKIISARYADDNEEHVQTFHLNDNINIVLDGKAYEHTLLNNPHDGRKNATNQDKIYQYFLEHEDDVIPTADIKKAFVPEMAENTMQAQLTNLINKGKIVKLLHGNYRLSN